MAQNVLLSIHRYVHHGDLVAFLENLRQKNYKKGKHVSMCFWEDTQGYDPKSIEIQVMTKENFVFIQDFYGKKSDKGEINMGWISYVPLGIGMSIFLIGYGGIFVCLFRENRA